MKETRKIFSKFYLLNSTNKFLHKRAHFIACASIINFILGIYMITSIIFIYENLSRNIDTLVLQSINRNHLVFFTNL